MLQSVKDHIERVKTSVEGSYGLTTLDTYIEQKTYLNGKPFSFEGHEFQRDVLKDPSPTQITVKIAQVGLSELAYRLALAACRVVDDFTVIYTFPNAGDATGFCKTRIDPIIAGSKDLTMALNRDLDNSEIKQFGRNSFLYMRGTRSQAGAISVPADMIIHDEWDKSDISTASMFIARLQHKPHKLRKLFSTPTFAKYGILKEAEDAKRLRHMAKCGCCGFRWLPDYFTDVKIPGYDKPLRELTKQNIIYTRWQEAEVICPKCGRNPQLAYENMEWVCENPDKAYQATARFISPFTVPKVLTPAYLVHNSTEYEKYSEFMNQGLGLAAEEGDDTISEADLDKCLVHADLSSGNVHVFAADMGLMCHIMIGRETPEGILLVVHKERCALSNFEVRRRELLIQYRCILSVHDSQPYVDLISRITERDHNAYGAIFATFKAGPVVRIEEQEEDREEGKMNFRMVKIKRNDALDSILALFKRNEIYVEKDEETDLEFKTQMQTLKRMQKFDKENALSYVWEKTGAENDHFHFALLYLWVGCRLRGTSTAPMAALAGVAPVRLARMR